MLLTPRYYQEDAIGKGLWAIEKFKDNSLLVLPTACHSKDYPIWMFDGSTKLVQNIQIGDQLIGKDGTVRNVLKTYQGFDRFYRITTKRGESFEVNENHILHLERTNVSKNMLGTYPEYVNVTVKDYLNWAKSRKHNYKLVQYGYEGYGNCSWAYLLGLWLGDGTSRTTSITNIDSEIIEYLEKFCNENDLCLKKINSTKYGYNIKGRRWRDNHFQKFLLDNNLIQNKHIPTKYFSLDRETRLKLLAGILDTDGSYHQTKRSFELGLSNEKLFDDCIKLAKSLGFYARKQVRKDVNGKTCWRTHITGFGIEKIPTLIKRKQAFPRKQIKNPLRHGFNTEFIGKKEYFGFLLDGDHLYLDGQGFVHHNSGKSVITAGIAERLGKEILVLQPSKEILEQNMKKLAMYVPEDEIGVYSASFKRKDINKYTFATIQSVYKVPELFEHIGQVIVDEADLINPRKVGTMFRYFLRAIDNPTVIGLTATPFRNVNDCVKDKNGNILRTTSLKLVNRMRPKFWSRIAYNINNQELFDEGFLCPLQYSSRTLFDQRKIPTNVTRSDFDLDAYTKMLDPYEQQIMDSISKAREYKKHILVFCASVEQAERMAKVITNSDVVTGTTKAKERTRMIDGFRNGTIKVLFNVGVLTVGFDHPELDCIYVIRPTKSLRLHLQILGRGVRIAEGKKSCVVIDYAGNYDTMGGVEDYKLIKEGNLWEVLAKGKKWHGVPLFDPNEYSPAKPAIRF